MQLKHKSLFGDYWYTFLEFYKYCYNKLYISQAF